MITFCSNKSGWVQVSVIARISRLWSTTKSLITNDLLLIDLSLIRQKSLGLNRLREPLGVNGIREIVVKFARFTFLFVGLIEQWALAKRLDTMVGIYSVRLV